MALTIDSGHPILTSPLGWIGKKFNVPHALLQFIIGRQPALEHGASVDRRDYSLRISIKQTDGENALQLGNRFRNGRLRNAKLCGRLRHASTLHDGKKDLQVPKSQAPADAGF